MLHQNYGHFFNVNSIVYHMLRIFARSNMKLDNNESLQPCDNPWNFTLIIRVSAWLLSIYYIISIINITKIIKWK